MSPRHKKNTFYVFKQHKIKMRWFQKIESLISKKHIQKDPTPDFELFFENRELTPHANSTFLRIVKFHIENFLYSKALSTT